MPNASVCCANTTTTNYSVVDTDLIERIYGVFYRQKVSGIPRHAFRCMTTVERATATAQGIELALRDAGSGEAKRRDLRRSDPGHRL